MKKLLETKFSLGVLHIFLITIIVFGVFSYGIYKYKTDLNHAKLQFETTSKELTFVIENLQKHIASTTVENRDLNDFVTILKARNYDFQNEIQEINNKVSVLEKLENIDPQLLQKYSKIYFLNENYLPSELSLVEPEFLLNKDKSIQVHTKVKGYLESMIRSARADGVDITILSGYRSFGTQATLKSQYTVVYGPTSNRFSADQGYSEHQLGTTVDFTTKKSGEILTGFDSTSAYKWLNENAYKFGFILSYPKNNGYYIFEPWHWRFVGVFLATYLHDNNKSFYSVPQRDIDSYLIKIFD